MYPYTRNLVNTCTKSNTLHCQYSNVYSLTLQFLPDGQYSNNETEYSLHSCLNNISVNRLGFYNLVHILVLAQLCFLIWCTH
jgi:hypothetical protein